MINAAKRAIEGITTEAEIYRNYSLTTLLMPSAVHYKCLLWLSTCSAGNYLMGKVDVLDYEKLVKFMNTQI